MHKIFIEDELYLIFFENGEEYDYFMGLGE